MISSFLLPYLHQYCISCLLDDSCLPDVKQNITVVLVHIAPMSKDTEHIINMFINPQLICSLTHYL